MRRVFGLTVLVGVLLVVIGATIPRSSQHSPTSSSTTTTLQPAHTVVSPVPVRACPSRSQGLHLAPAPAPGASQPLAIPSTLVGKIALYQGGGVRILAPSGWLCQASIYFDGNVIMSIAPDETDAVGFFPEPSSNRSNSARVQFNGIPTCAECSLAQVCPFFVAAITLLHDVGGSTTGCHLSSGEVIASRSPGLVGFLDPPGVVGHGTPSGGPYVASSKAYFARHGTTIIGSYVVSCTLPGNLATICSTSLKSFALTHPHYGL